MSNQCPHCGAAALLGASFCENCGKALPEGGGPRVVQSGSMATTATGQSLQSRELASKAKTASIALLVVAILQVLGGFLLIMLARSVDAELPPVVLGIVFGLAVVYAGLFWWARTHPLPASVIGLVLYGTLMIADALADPASIARGIILKIIIVALLIKAIRAGMQHRELAREMRR